MDGVIKVASVVNAAQCLWRPTLLYDGQIEYVVDGEATGRIILVQITGNIQGLIQGDSNTITQTLGEIPKER